MKRLFLTGFPGWLGDNIVGDFIASPWDGFSVLRCLVAPWVSQAVVENIGKRFPGVELVRGDLQNRDTLDAALKDCHAILHSAGIIHVRRPKDWFDVNFRGTANLLQAAKRAGSVERFVFVSSNAAGGSSLTGELLTESMPTQPRSSYGRSKRLAEDVLRDDAGEIATVILRPCMFYGTPVPDRHVEFFKRVRSGVIPMIGASLPRSMIHVRNLVEACRLAFAPGVPSGKTFYLADERAYSVQEYVDTVARCLEVEPRLLRLPSVLANVAYGLDRVLESLGWYNQNIHLLGEANWSVGVSIDEAKRHLGFKPRYALLDGVREAVGWCKERRLI